MQITNLIRREFFVPRRAAGLLVISILITTLAFCLVVGAQGNLLQLAGEGAFREMLLDAPPPPSRGALVGASIVGVRLDGPPSDFDPKGVRVLLGQGHAVKDLLCVRFISRDGRYSAQARYRLVSGVGPIPVLETKTSYEKQLAGYRSTDMAIMARSARSCDDSKGGDLFAVVLGPTSNSPLVVLINGGDARVRAQLGQNNNAVTQAVVCTPVMGQVRVGFTQECRLNLPSNFEPGSYQLSIGETASTGEISVHTYGLTLYRAANDSK